MAYTGLKEKFGGKPWYEWPGHLRTYSAEAVSEAWDYLGYEGIQFHCFVQYLFYKQWNDLRRYAHEKGIQIIGDVPIYVPLDSVDVWANPDCFQLDEKGFPIEVAGVPPDYFCEDGQLRAGNGSARGIH